ncbi:MAG TPA: pyridoxal phosphate-dependent aminotransferase [Syntrophales bacterium]|nr:pyridoxal phosphate-dependent aminotransferase [Syntrophales bacterium]HPQ42849.1 pyridoxal phosphate-dependent aminotransferase [Syntrophales bacterium]
MVTKRASEIPPFIVMDILEKAQEMQRDGKDIIHMEVGEPDFDTPECINEACCKAIRDGKTHYTHSLGLIELREAICEHYYNRYGVNISPDRIIVTSGTSPAMFLLFSALIERGDEIIISDPHYACYPNFISFLEGVPARVNVFEENGFQYTPEGIKEKITPKTRGIMINSPSNPTGNLLSTERMEQIASYGIPVIADEIYHGLVYEEKEHSILEFTDNAFVLNGFSKAYAMTGWRLGYLIAPKEYIRPMQKIQQNFFISPNSFAQWGGIAALREAEGDVIRMRNIFNERRKFIIRRLREIGLGITVEPTGAFYILGNIKSFSSNSYKTAFDILEKAHVGVTPGIDFGKNCEGYIRFSYATSMENIDEGINRIERYLEEYA